MNRLRSFTCIAGIVASIAATAQTPPNNGQARSASLIPEGITAVYGFDGDNSLIVATGGSGRTVDARPGLVPEGTETLYGFDGDNSVLTLNRADHNRFVSGLRGRLDSRLAKLVESQLQPAPAKAAQGKVEPAKIASREKVVISLTALPPGALQTLRNLGFQVTGGLTFDHKLAGTLPSSRIAVTAFQKFIRRIDSAESK